MVGDAEHDMRSSGVFHLGEVRAYGPSPHAPGESPATRPTRRWAIMVAVFLVGAVLGSYAWLVRSDLLGSDHVDLIVTDVTHDAPLSDGTLTSVSAVVHNSGSDDVTITGASLPGQSTTGDRGADGVAIPAGGEATVRLSGELHCGTGWPDTIVAEVRTPAGESSAQLAVPRTDSGHAGHCGPAGAGDIWIENPSGPSAAVELREWSDSGLEVAVPLGFRSWTVSQVEIIDVAVSAVPGLAADPGGLSGMRKTHTVGGLRIDWTVSDCSDAYHGEPIDITVTFADHPPATVRAPVDLQYMLAGMIGLACDDGAS